MLDIKLIREHSSDLTKAVKNKGVAINIEKVKKLDEELRSLQTQVQELQSQKNKIAKEKDVEKGKKVKEELKTKEDKFRELNTELQELLLQIPNPAASDVKIGKNESENDVVKKHGEPTKFSFDPKDHQTLGEALDIIDVKRAAKVSGSRFSYLKNEGALLELALVNLAMDVLTKEGFIPVIPPVLVTEKTMAGLGYLEHGGKDDMFSIPKDNLLLVGTSEQSIVPMHMNEVLQKKDLPIRYVGFSTSFRRESGSYGKDVKGILRLHQFNKVEMVSFTASGEGDKEHEYLLSLEEKLLKLLEVPYQVVKMCTGDLGFPAARKYDIEAWIPSQNKYREVTSTSTTTDFQARRLNIKYQDGDKKEFVHVLNGTAFSDRPLIAIIENHQQKDGSVKIPEALQKYTGFKIIKPKA